MAKDCCFTTDGPAGSVLDPRKRVRYFTGQVLGEDEFRQDQLYHNTRDELHQRALHGYGRVSGLHVDQRPTDAGGVEIVVGAGLAVNPKGETICVHHAQCADLNAWLKGHRDDLLGSPPLLPGAVTLYLVLCARDCETDLVPVLGDPCRTLSDATAASRIADDFELCFRPEPPFHAEEQAIRELGTFLRSIEITDAAPGLTGELAAMVREMFLGTASPVEAQGGSPPAALTLHPDEALAALEAAIYVWVTEIRPTLNPETGACEIPRDGDAGRCVLIGCIDVQFDEGPGGLEVSGPVMIDGACGPILLQTRLLQELGLGVLPALAGIGAFPTLSPPVGGAEADGPLPPDADASPPAGPVPDGDVAAPPLPQVIALSWVHDNASLLRLVHDGGQVRGLALGFGLADGGGAPVDPATLTPETVRVGLRLRADDGPAGLPLLAYREVVGAEIVPVEVRLTAGQITETRRSAGAGGADGVLFRFDEPVADALMELGGRIFVELVADQILDLEGRPLASAFPRRTRPGARGGHFESWVEAGRPRIILNGVDLNTAPAVEIRGLPNIGNALAGRIVELRESRGGFDVLDDLAGVQGISPALLENLRRLLET